MTAVRPWYLTRPGSVVATVALPVLLAFAVVARPLPALLLACGAAFATLLFRRPFTVVLLLVALMGNVKINYYTGSFTIFPDYIPLGAGMVVAVALWMDGRLVVQEAGMLCLLGAFVVACGLSAVDAIDVAGVAGRAFIVGLAACTVFLVVTHTRSRGEMARAVAWLECAAFVVAGYGVLQMIAAVAGFRVDIPGLAAHGNPAFVYSIGSPVVYAFTKFFRANSFFNDSNILSGYVSAALALVLACTLAHLGLRRRARAALETVLLLVLVLCLLLTLSRSGFLGAATGCAIVLWQMPAILKSARFWIVAGAGAGAAALVSAQLGINPALLFIRLFTTVQVADASTRTHADVALYALTLLARYPIFGVGLRNFSLHYAGEVDFHVKNMMAHNAYLGYLAEAGLLGGGLFLAIAVAIALRLRRALRDARAPGVDPERRAWVVGFAGALASLAVTNVFYDFSTRTFVWVLVALALVSTRIVRPAAAT